MKKLILSILFCSVATYSFAQGKHADPRVMKGFDASAIPAMKSLTDLKLQPGGLTKNARQIGNAGFVRKEAPQAKIEAVDQPNSERGKDFSLWKVERAANGTANWMWRASTKSHSVTTQSVKNTDGLLVLQGLSAALRIADPRSEFEQMSTVTDELGYKHLRYLQVYHGIPVWNRDLYLHLDPAGEPYTINGTYEPTPKNINTIPSISSPNAISIAIADLKIQGRWAPVGPDVAKELGFDDPAAKLVIYPEQSGALKLAYEVSITANLLESYYYIVDASSGEVITKIARHCSIVPNDGKNHPVTVSHFQSAGNELPLQPQAGFTDASGTDLNGVNQSLRAYQHTDGKFYAIWDLPSIDLGKSVLPDQPQGGALTLTLNNQDYTQNSSIFHNSFSSNTWSEPTVVSAHHNTLVTYNYYSSTFSRKAIDNNNGTINAIIHVTQNGAGMDNAFWNGSGKVMIYGDGNTAFKPLAGGIDVAGHEMTHGVINNTADLVYQFQSGALNESFADVFGVMVDTRNLTVGEDIMQPGKGTCLRDMNDPTNPSGFSHQPAHMNQFNNLGADQDNGGVHINSGIPNRACAILINQLGRDKVQKMYYRALTVYLTRNSQFTDCRQAVESAAKDLFGASSSEFNAVGPAFDAVGITGPATNPSGEDIPAQTGGTQYIAFTDNSGQIGLLDPASGNWVLATSAAAAARVSNSGTSRAQLSAPRSGAHVYFVDLTGHLCFLEISSGNVFTFPNLHLHTDGDLWNASVSPDESAVALTTSPNPNDPNIYIFDGTNVFIQPLKPVNTDADSLVTIDYPDVISWGPNKFVPKLGFDALLSTQLGGTPISYWSMYEINYSTRKTYDLIAAQPTNVDIGNISYSNTSPNVIAFNAISAGVEDVAVADFKNNVIAALGVNNNNIKGQGIFDADKPSFSPNDQFLSFSSASNNSILFYQLANQQLTFLQFTIAMFVPYWFLSGGSAGVHEAANTSSQDVSVYPSVISGNATAAFTIKTSQDVTLDVLNLFGQTVHAITKEHMDAGSREVTFDVKSLASGTYFVRLATKEGQAMAKITIEK